MASQWKVIGGKRFREVNNGVRGTVRTERVLMVNVVADDAPLDLLTVCEVKPGGERRGNCKLGLSLDTWRHVLPVIQEALEYESNLAAAG